LRLRNSLLTAVALLSLGGCSPVKPPDQGVFLDPSLAPLIPSDTNLMIGVRVEKLAMSPLFPQAARLEMIGGFAREAGVDAASRLWQVVLVSNGRRQVLLARGKFTNGIIAPELVRKGGSRFSYRSMNMFGDEQNAVIFVNSTTALWGETPVLREIADQKQAGSGPPAALLARMREIPRDTQLWGVYAGGPVNVPLTGNLQNLTKILGMVSGGLFYFDLSQGVQGTVTGLAASPADARQLHDALAGFVGLGRMLAPKNQPDLLRAFDGIRVEQQDTRVQLAITVPEEIARQAVALLNP
jgi:hypothetical protein